MNSGMSRLSLCSRSWRLNDECENFLCICHSFCRAPFDWRLGCYQRVVEVSEQLRCLVCQNQSIAESNAELAVDLRNQVIEQVKAGKTNKEIVDYMVERYGDFVLYKPPFKASTAILWLGPVALFIIGLGAFFVNLRRRKSTIAQGQQPLTSEEKAIAQRMLLGG